MLGGGTATILDDETHPLRGGTVTAIGWDGGGNLWIAAGGISRWTGTEWNHFDSQDEDWFTLNSISGIARAPNGNIWFQTQNELVEIDQGSLTGTIRGGGYTGNSYAGPYFTDDGAVWTLSARVSGGTETDIVDFLTGGTVEDWSTIGVEAGRYVWGWQPAKVDGQGNIWVPIGNNGVLVYFGTY